MGIDSGIYKVVLALHILCAIIGFGAVFLNALYGQEVKKRQGPGGLAVMEANLRVSMIGEYFIYAVFVLGFALVGLSDKAWEFSDLWITLSIVLYIVGIGLSHGVMMPTVKKMRNLIAELVAAGPPPAGGTGGPPPQAVEMERLGKTMGMVGPVLNLILIAIVFLMVWKPT